jgi:ABC-type nickel/cobalt efflux system permease component RcnA
MPWLVVAGIFLGSALWWLVLSIGVARLQARHERRWQQVVQRASALLLLSFALWQLWGLLPAQAGLARAGLEGAPLHAGPLAQVRVEP